jgi:hypothetical protein
VDLVVLAAKVALVAWLEMLDLLANLVVPVQLDLLANLEQMVLLVLAEQVA